MLNQLTAFVRRQEMIAPGDHVICAVSGGADSVALLFAMYLLREKLQIRLSAAHFNHGLRGAESDRDEAFVRQLCDRYDIPLYVGSGRVEAGEKGLEAAAREARYGFLRTLPGKIATAHTANDNAETVLLHLVRGTALKGLCGIHPVGNNLIRPMLTVTRQQVQEFLREYCLSYVEDSSNATDQFLRNRLRHHVVPLLEQENPRFAESLSAMALGLQPDAALLDHLAENAYTTHIPALRAMEPALRGRVLERFLIKTGIREPERTHLALVEQLVFSENPSARADLPGGITVERCYDILQQRMPKAAWQAVATAIPGITQLPELGLQLVCSPEGPGFRAQIRGTVMLRPREPGDRLRLPGGSKSLKKLMIDRKIPAARRNCLPVLTDEAGILGVCGIGPDQDRLTPDRGWYFRFEPIPANTDEGETTH